MNLKDFGKRAAAQRAIRGWSLRDLSEACGISFSNLSRIEQGMDTTLSSMQKIAAAFDVPLAQMLSDMPDALTSDQRAVLTAYAAGDVEALTRLALARIDALKTGG